MTKKYYSTTEVAHILRISRVSVFNRIRNGNLKAEKVGRNYIVSHEALLEALGKSLGREREKGIEQAIDRAIRDYGKAFKMLGRE